MMVQIRVAIAWLTAFAQVRRRDDRGSDIVQMVIIVGLMAAAAIVIVGLLVAKATDAANSVRTQ
jgi:hypothetical protein